MNCFFCCKILPKEEICNPNDDTEADINYFENTSTVTARANSDSSNFYSTNFNQNILRISHYLQISKNKLEKDNGNFSSALNCCQECREISRKLGDLCGLLEVTQMRINYYLNLLTDQILKKDGYLENQQITLSPFQENFHQKCLTKLAKVDSNPVLQLSKVILRPVEDITPIKLEEKDIVNFGEMYDNVTTEETAFKPILTLKFNNHKYRKFRCDFCPVVFNSILLQNRHINASHLRKKTDSRHLFKPCVYCGAMLSTRHLGAHKRNVHGVGRKETDQPVFRNYYRCNCGEIIRDVNRKSHKINCGKTSHPKYSVRKVKCDICEKLLSYRNISTHRKNVHGINSEGKGLIDKLIGPQETNNDGDKNVTLGEYEYKPIIDHGPKTKYHFEKFSCDFCPMKLNSLKNKSRHIQSSHMGQRTPAGCLIKACEYCGAMMSSKHLSTHKKKMHGILGNGTDKVELERKYERCCECGQVVRDTNMKAHKMKCAHSVKKSGIRYASHKDRPKVKCDICEKLISYKNISAHKKHVHGIMSNRKGTKGENLV